MLPQQLRPRTAEDIAAEKSVTRAQLAVIAHLAARAASEPSESQLSGRDDFPTTEPQSEPANVSAVDTSIAARPAAATPPSCFAHANNFGPPPVRAAMSNYAQTPTTITPLSKQETPKRNTVASKAQGGYAPPSVRLRGETSSVGYAKPFNSSAPSLQGVNSDRLAMIAMTPEPREVRAAGVEGGGTFGATGMNSVPLGKTSRFGQPPRSRSRSPETYMAHPAEALLERPNPSRSFRESTYGGRRNVESRYRERSDRRPANTSASVREDTEEIDRYQQQVAYGELCNLVFSKVRGAADRRCLRNNKCDDFKVDETIKDALDVLRPLMVRGPEVQTD